MNVRFTHFTVIVAVCAMLAAPSFAADRERIEGRGYFMAGAQAMDIDELNSRLSANGYGTFPETFATFGGGGYGIIGRFLIGGEGMGVVTGSESGTVGTDYFKTMLAGGYGMVKFGYIVYRRGGCIFYPAFGIGGGGLSLDIRKDATEPFDQFLANPRRRTTLSTGFLLLDLGIGVDHLAILGGKGEDRGGIVFGVKAGYMLSPYRSDWGDALDGPDSGIEGAYFRIVIGGGGTGSR